MASFFFDGLLREGEREGGREGRREGEREGVFLNPKKDKAKT